MVPLMNCHLTLSSNLMCQNQPSFLLTREKIAIKMKVIFNQCIICVNNTIEKFYRPRITKQMALFCTKKALIGEAITGYSSHKRSTNWYNLLEYKQVITFIWYLCYQHLSSASPCTPVITISYSYWVITITYHSWQDIPTLEVSIGSWSAST